MVAGPRRSGGANPSASRDEPRAGLDAGLTRFETEFATYAFLQRVEREIDDLLHQAGNRMAGADSVRGVDLAGPVLRRSLGAPRPSPPSSSI